MNRRAVLVLALPLAFAVGCSGSGAAQELAAAAEACNEGPGRPVDVADDGSSVSTTDLEAYLCLADELEAPESLRTRIGNTTGMMGGQEDTVGDLLWLWSYHSGNTPPFDLTITLADQ